MKKSQFLLIIVFLFFGTIGIFFMRDANTFLDRIVYFLLSLFIYLPAFGYYVGYFLTRNNK